MGRTRNIQTKIYLTKEERNLLDKLVESKNTTITNLIIELIRKEQESNGQKR